MTRIDKWFFVDGCGYIVFRDTKGEWVSCNPDTSSPKPYGVNTEVEQLWSNKLNIDDDIVMGKDFLDRQFKIELGEKLPEYIELIEAYNDIELRDKILVSWFVAEDIDADHSRSDEQHYDFVAYNLGTGKHVVFWDFFKHYEEKEGTLNWVRDRSSGEEFLINWHSCARASSLASLDKFGNKYPGFKEENRKLSFGLRCKLDIERIRTELTTLL